MIRGQPALSLPAMSTVMDVDDTGMQCVICMEELLFASEDIHTLPCDHKFHQRCVDAFVQAQPVDRGYDFMKCPLCRQDVGEMMIATLLQNTEENDTLTMGPSAHSDVGTEDGCETLGSDLDMDPDLDLVEALSQTGPLSSGNELAWPTDADGQGDFRVSAVAEPAGGGAVSPAPAPAPTPPRPTATPEGRPKAAAKPKAEAKPKAAAKPKAKPKTKAKATPKPKAAALRRSGASLTLVDSFALSATADESAAAVPGLTAAGFVGEAGAFAEGSFGAAVGTIGGDGLVGELASGGVVADSGFPIAAYGDVGGANPPAVLATSVRPPLPPFIGVPFAKAVAKPVAAPKRKGKAKPKAKAAAAVVAEPEPSLPSAVVRPPMLVSASNEEANAKDQVVCSWCGSEVTKLRARGKGSEKWQCNSCNSKCVALSRICGGWPNQDFKDLPLDQQQSFFKEIAGKDSKKIRGLVEDLLERIEKKETNFSEGGAFLPLSVWERKGFNINDIKEKSLPCDKREHRVLGDTYRVRIEALTKSNTTALHRAKRICGAQAPPAGTVPSGLRSNHHQPPQGSGWTSQGEMPSGSCSLTSPDGFADMQARVKAHADKVKEAVKITVTMKKVSTSNEEKSRKILDMFSRLLQDPSVANAPREILGAMKHFLEDVTRFHDECSVDMVNPNSSGLTPETAKQVSVFAPARAPPPSTTFSRQMESGGGFGNNGR